MIGNVFLHQTLNATMATIAAKLIAAKNADIQNAINRINTSDYTIQLRSQLNFFFHYQKLVASQPIKLGWQKLYRLSTT